MLRLWSLVVLFLGAGCAHSERFSEGRRTRPPEHRGALEAARAFVDAVNRLDADTAASLIDWDVWVAEDAQLHFLLSEIRNMAQRTPPSATDLARRPIEGSEITLGEIVESPDAPKLVARISRDRFKTAMREDFAAGVRKMDAELRAWNLDRVDRSATLFMPNGETVEMVLLRREGRWRLVPRWYP